jgi:hypothetical protein
VVWVSSTKYGTVTLEDYSVNVKNVIREKAIQFLEEAGEEVLSMTIRNTARDTGQTAGSWSKTVDEGNLAVHIGSDHPNAIWEEFGTGKFAEKGDGRKGWWVFIKGSKGSGSGGKTYSTQKEAKRAMAILRKKGLNAFYTQGKKARHPFRDAFNASKKKIERHAQKVFGGI